MNYPVVTREIKRRKYQLLFFLLLRTFMKKSLAYKLAIIDITVKISLPNKAN